MPSFGKILALIFSLTISSLLLTINFFPRTVSAQQQYYFQEEFNQERPAGVLDPDKWIVYPNKRTQPDHLGCMFDTVNETGGILILKQCSGTPQFPYVVSKITPFPNGDFTATVRFQFPSNGAIPTGVRFVDTAPPNGGQPADLFGVGFYTTIWESLGMHFEYKGEAVFSAPANSSYRIFKLTKEGNIYKMYFNEQLVFTSPPIQEKVRTIYMGNPAVIVTPGWPWSWPRIDYIRVVDNGPSEIIPEPFLDLPWDYSGSGKDFKQIVFNPNSWFDHKYPLQNYSSSVLGVVKFTGKPEDDYYKSHSGYDYGSPHGVIENTPVLAAAAGKATFISETNSEGAGNMIKIDHGNGYQTWYEHLEEVKPGHQLIVSEEGKEVEVAKGQPIGRVGLTGRTTGFHIHLSVFKDINGNGDFSDDYPFGLTDPLGWEGDYVDPWEEYTQGDKHGAKSYKLFTGLTPPKTQLLTPTGGTISNNEFTLNVPPNSVNQNTNFKIDFGPFEKASEIIKNIVPSLFLSATNNLGLAITNFNNPLGLIYDYSKADLSNINEDTISFYFFNLQTGVWEKISSVLDKTHQTISTQTNHFSQFAVMAELLDTTAPETRAELTGDKGTNNWYRSDVTVALLPEDNPGGKGVSYSVYSLDGEHWDKYEAPLEFKDDGSHKIYFLSHDSVGNQEGIKSVEFFIDKTPPVISAIATVENSEYTPGTWVKKDVTVSFSCADDYSGVLSVTEPEVISNEGENQKAKGVCLDKAGNSSEIEFAGINIDKTSPVINLEANPTFLWPPSNKMVDVFLTGEILETNLKLNTLNIEDEYNLVEPEIKSLNQVIKLQASRNGEDLDGRVYTIKAYAEDLASNSFEKIIKIIVPHDEGS